MKLTLTSTDELVTINGAMCRVWQGTTEAGVRCRAFVICVEVDDRAPLAEFVRDLAEVDRPVGAPR